MKYQLNSDISIFILRTSLAAVLLTHSVYLKMFVFTLAGNAQYFSSIGLPEILGYIVFVLEAISGFALLLGYKTRFFSAFIVPVLFGATWAHSANGWLFSNSGGGWEYPLLLSVMAIAQIGLGDGKYAISNYLQLKRQLASQ
ncbi:DoxX family protein [Aliikangiella sp. IMCC44359]|uniref:DoxX family protein n=1 Tax=Aliikangiella sp. IMCC44359 TaxID=3459125 RepID=UPI00403ADD5E